MSYPNRLEPPEDDYSDDEWDTAREQLVEERRDLGWTEAQIDLAIDDYLIAEKCDAIRQDRESVQADEEHARRKENR